MVSTMHVAAIPRVATIWGVAFYNKYSIYPMWLLWLWCYCSPLQAFLGVVGRNVDQLEESMSKAEKELDPNKLRKVFSALPGLVNAKYNYDTDYTCNGLLQFIHTHSHTNSDVHHLRLYCNNTHTRLQCLPCRQSPWLCPLHFIIRFSSLIISHTHITASKYEQAWSNLQLATPKTV